MVSDWRRHSPVFGRSTDAAEVRICAVSAWLLRGVLLILFGALVLSIDMGAIATLLAKEIRDRPWARPPGRFSRTGVGQVVDHKTAFAAPCAVSARTVFRILTSPCVFSRA
jgi:hypothetical protein